MGVVSEGDEKPDDSFGDLSTDYRGRQQMASTGDGDPDDSSVDSWTLIGGHGENIHYPKSDF